MRLSIAQHAIQYPVGTLPVKLLHVLAILAQQITQYRDSYTQYQVSSDSQAHKSERVEQMVWV